MIWMPLTLINVLCSIFLTSVTGAIFTVLFVVVGKILERMGFLHIRYELLKVAAFFYLCPVSYLSLKLYELEIGYGKLFQPTPWIARISAVIILVWCVGMLLGIGWLCYDLYRLKGRYRQEFDCKKRMQELFQQVKKELKVPEKVCLCQSYGAKVPCMVGIRRPQLILPVEEYEERYLRMILLHELTHYKQKDILLKRITFCILILHFFNPMAWFLFFQVQKQSEYVCDYRVVKYTGDVRGYVQSLMLVAGGDKWFSVLSSQLFVRKHDLVERVKKMKETRKVKIRSKWSVALVLSIAMLTSNMTVYAATQEAAETYVEWYEETNTEDTEQLQESNQLEEFCEYASSDSKVVTVQGEVVEERSGSATFEWTVNPNVKMCASYIRCYEGDEITVVVDVEPSDVYIRVGIERADGYKRYVYSKGRIIHTFSITEDGIWRVYVENTSSTAVDVHGSYVY